MCFCHPQLWVGAVNELVGDEWFVLALALCGDSFQLPAATYGVADDFLVSSGVWSIRNLNWGHEAMHPSGLSSGICVHVERFH